MTIKRREIVNDIEHKIITGLITSDQFARRMLPILQSNYFETDYAEKIFSWCKDHFMVYDKAPQQLIQDIYATNRDTLDEAKQELIESFLQTISDKYEQEPDFNVEYFIDQALISIKKREIKRRADKAIRYLESGRVDKAEQEFQDYQKVAKMVTTWVNPFASSIIKDTLQSDEDGGDHIFKFSGALGDLSGWHDRSMLVAFLAPMKRGKSFFLLECAVQAVLNRKRVAFFSLEMSTKQVEKRILKRIGAYGKKSGGVLYPCFDCVKNQNNSCTKSIRVNRKRLFTKDDKKPLFNDNDIYRPCTECRGNQNDYEAATWYTRIHRDIPTPASLVKKAGGIQKMFGDNFRMISYPAGSANIGNIKNDLNSLEYTEGFIPDVIIIDYADILKPEDSRVSDPRAIANTTWVTLKGLSDSRHCLVITASQGTRKSIEKKNIGQVDVAEDIRKLAHINRMYGLSQSMEEKKQGFIRVSVIGEREDEFNERDQVMVLQQLSMGQVILDSELMKTYAISDSDKILTSILED